MMNNYIDENTKLKYSIIYTEKNKLIEIKKKCLLKMKKNF